MDIYDDWRSASDERTLNFRLTFTAVNGIKQGPEQTDDRGSAGSEEQRCREGDENARPIPTPVSSTGQALTLPLKGREL